MWPTLFYVTLLGIKIDVFGFFLALSPIRRVRTSIRTPNLRHAPTSVIDVVEKVYESDGVETIVSVITPSSGNVFEKMSSQQ